MARKKEKGKKPKSSAPSSFLTGLHEETIRNVAALIFFALAAVLVLAALNSAGVVGRRIFDSFSLLLGLGYGLLPLLLVGGGLYLLRSFQGFVNTFRIISALIFFTSALGITNLVSAGKGGIIGGYIAALFVSLFDVYATLIILATAMVISLVVMIDTPLDFSWLLFWRRDAADPLIAEEYIESPEEEVYEELGEEGEEVLPEEGPRIATLLKEAPKKTGPIISPIPHGAYTPPPLSLLEKDRGKPGVGDIKANANIIKRTLQNFGIQVEMDEISIGPSVTRYTLKPAEGVRLSKIIGLHNNLELALAAHPVRIEAPIPGKSLVGIEVPNSAKATVGLATLLSSIQFQESEKSLLVGLGRDIAGGSHFADLAKMPHLLIAGATGSGKSVTIHTLITSLIYRNSPEEMRFIMVDPKRVELTLYNNIPHLLTPVITDAKKAILVLKWLGKEMDRRYDILEAESVRDIDSYHKNILAPAFARAKPTDEATFPETMPYIVVIIDELADIMQTYPKELEAAVVRLAQMSRAVGIHLVLSTQRPSVNVITGLIKANIPARIALQVASQIDSRTILDGAGAEKLLGAGDMLYLSADMAKPIRIQSAFISEQEVKRVTKFTIDHNAARGEGLDLTGEQSKNAVFSAAFEDNTDLGDDDNLYDEARAIVVEAGKASTSYLQRRLRIGYARAARLMDILEERGIIGPADGARPRNIVSSESGPTSEEEI